MSKSQQNLPLELADVFEELNQHISWLHANWLIFEQLFATGEERVKLLNEFAPIFFRLCQDSFSDNVILSIARLTDPPKSAGKDTLSLEQLVSKINPSLYPDLRSALEQQFSALKTCCQPIRNVRNRRLAHNDLGIALELDPNPLPDILKDEVDNILQRIREFMNTIWTYFNSNSELGYEVIMPNDGEAIIVALEKAKKYHEITRRRYENLNKN
jgi:hypothetical protein